MFDISNQIHFEVNGGLKAIAPAYAVQITEDMSLGATLNFWKDITWGNNGWKEEYRSMGQGQFVGTTILGTFDYSNHYTDFRGFNFNLGILWNITDMITFAAVVKSPFTGKMDRRARYFSTQAFPDLGQTDPPTNYQEHDWVELHMPLSYGAGLSFRLSDEFTLAFDFYRAEWGSYYLQPTNGARTSPIDQQFSLWLLIMKNRTRITRIQRIYADFFLYLSAKICLIRVIRVLLVSWKS